MTHGCANDNKDDSELYHWLDLSKPLEPTHLPPTDPSRWTRRAEGEVCLDRMRTGIVPQDTAFERFRTSLR